MGGKVTGSLPPWYAGACGPPGPHRPPRGLGTRSGTQQRSYDIIRWGAGLYDVNVFSNGRPITKRLVVQ